MAPPPMLGLVLAGGLSRRMGGGDKPLLRLGGRTILERVVERLAPQCPSGLVLSANGDPARFAGFPGLILPDTVAGHPGPLAGVLAGLDAAAARNAGTISSDPLPHPEVPERSGNLEGRLQDPPRSLEGSFEAADAAPQDEGKGRIRHVISVPGDAPFLPRDLVARLYAALGPQDDRIALAVSGERQHYTVALWPLEVRHALRAGLVERGERRAGAFIARTGFVEVAWPIEPVDPFLNVNTPEDLAVAEAALAANER